MQQNVEKGKWSEYFLNALFTVSVLCVYRYVICSCFPCVCVCVCMCVCSECPVDLFFVLDTSESVALRAKPPNFYIDQIKSFTERFIMELKEMRHPCDRSLTWNSGALHYSDEIILVRQLSDIATERQALISDIKGISYIGKGTHTDCAIKRGIAELLIGGSHYQENKYIVVVTDGHPLTGYKEPCGGLQEAANEARHHGVKVFSVAISPDQEDTRLSVIATDQNYRQNFTAADNSRSTQLQTIRSIIDMIGDRGGIGNKGERGHKGYKGDKGRQGTDGVDGRKGDPGFPGLAGCKGSPGPDGSQGDGGPKGDPGPYGTKGAKGDRGKNGEPGRPGNYGPPGTKGTLGPKGANGDKGQRGDDGAPGPDGLRGDKVFTLYYYYTVCLCVCIYGSVCLCGPKGPRGIKGAPGDRGQIGARVRERARGGVRGAGGEGEECVQCVSKKERKKERWLKFSCKCGPLDLAFIVDSSESIGSTNFALAKDFIITVIDRLIKDQQVHFGFNESRVGVVQYSGDGAQEAVRLGDPNINTLTELKQAVRDLRWLAEATYTGEALQFSLTNMIDRLQQENRVVLVLTDGRSDITRDKTPLNTLCGKGIKVGGLGVKDYSGRQPNHEQLSAVVCTSDPKPGFSFVLENFAELLDDSFLQNLTTRICEDKKCPNYKCPISFSGDTDIVLMMDSSASVGQRNFDSSKTFVKRLAERFLSAERSGRAAVRVAVGQYSRERRMEAELTSNLTLLTSKIEAATFQNDGTDVTKAMAFAMEKFQMSGGGNRKRKLVLFSDGRSQGVTEAMLEKRVRLVSEAGVELYVITVGNQVSEANLRSLVSRGRSYDVTYAQRHLFRVPDYPSLLRGVFYQTVSRRVSQA
uniref:VWFA domain-containing protein n=1 Tax=Oncorhynchus tshawytscha TaxID=74940 RepID=A0AAZ3SM65_ONCTS